MEGNRERMQNAKIKNQNDNVKCKMSSKTEEISHGCSKEALKIIDFLKILNFDLSF